MAENGNEEIIWPSQVAAFLDDLFAVYDTYRGHRAGNIRSENVAYRTAKDALLSPETTYESFDALINSVYTGVFGAEIETDTIGPFKSDVEVMDRYLLDSLGGRIWSTVCQKVGSVTLKRDEAVWASIWQLWSDEDAAKYLYRLGVHTNDQPTLHNLVSSQPDIRGALWTARRWPNNTECGQWAKDRGIGANPLYLKYLESTSTPAGIEAAISYLFIGGMKWDTIKEKLPAFGALTPEVDYWLWSTRTKPPPIEAYRLNKTGLIADSFYDTLMPHLGGWKTYDMFYKAEHYRRFGVADWVRFGYWNTEHWYNRAETKDAVSYLGYTSEDKDILEYVSLNKPTPYDIITAWRRMQYAEKGEIPALSADDKTLMRSVGVHPKFMKYYWASSMAYPSAPDLITMAVREAFEPALVSKYGLSQDFPPEFRNRSKQIGIPEYWALKYWQAHWRLPSLTEGTEMLHRKIITGDEFRDLLKMADYTPYWRPKLEQVAYRVYTRVDVRRMFRVGVLTFDQVVEAYLDYGYDQKRATNLAEFVRRQAYTTLSTINQTDVIGAYGDKSITRAEAAGYLKMIFIPADLISGILDKAELVREVRYERLVCSAVERGYKRGKYEKHQAIGKMTTRGVPTDKARSLADLWELEIE